MEQRDTIAAIATAAGDGGIAIVRISGTKATEIAKKVLKRGTRLRNRTAVLSTVCFNTVQDEVLVLYFQAPRSYTGEDVVEIQCHGSYFLAGRIVEGLIEHGCRLANPGEFTQRAFWNGRMDLTRCEAVLDLIHAQSDAAAKAAYAALKGGLYHELADMQAELVALIAAASVAVDYPEEDLTEPLIEELLPKIEALKTKLTDLKESYHAGVLLRDGVRVAIVGEPNVGKSMLLNRLLGRDRAIVTDKAGTTRDTVEESFLCEGIKMVLIDTAGIRQATDAPEQLGIERSRVAAQTANLILAVSVAGGAPYTDTPHGVPTLRVYNKTDVWQGEKTQADAVYVSAKTGENVAQLKQAMASVVQGKISGSGVKLTNLRHLTACKAALEALDRAACDNSVQMDCLLSDLNEALRQLGSITGIYASDEVIAKIFASFCVGK